MIHIQTRYIIILLFIKFILRRYQLNLFYFIKLYSLCFLNVLFSLHKNVSNLMIYLFK